MSAERYLPETTGAGCAFLDYDNDGWMDIYLVNSGKCDFYTPDPPLRNALYSNNRDGTFTDVTEKAGVMRRWLRARRRGRRLRRRRISRSLRTAVWPQHSISQQRGWHVYRRDRKGRRIQRPGWASSAVWFDYDNDGRLDLFVCRFVDFDKAKHHRCGSQDPGLAGQAEYCNPRSLRSHARAGCFTTTATAHSLTSASKPGSPTSRKGMGRGRRRHQ